MEKITRTLEWFNNEVRFVHDKEASTPEVRVARCDSEPRLTFERKSQDVWYAVDGVRVEDQTAEGVVAALNAEKAA